MVLIVFCVLELFFCCYLHGFNRFLVFTEGSSLFFAAISMGFKELLFFCLTVHGF